MRVFVHMLGFNTPEMIRGALENFRSTVEPSHEIVKTLFDPGFPREQQGEKLRVLAEVFGWGYQEIQNKGVAENWNSVFEHFQPNASDIVVGFDPDCRLSGKGWLPAMTSCLRRNLEAPFCMPTQRYHEEHWCSQYHGRKVFEKGGLRLARFSRLISWSMGGWRAEWIQSIGGFKAHNPVYGYIEHYLYEKMRRDGKTFYALADWYDDHQGTPDADYQKWKDLSAQHRTRLLFEDWLKAGRPT